MELKRTVETLQEDVVGLLNESAEFRGDVDSSFSSDIHSVSFQEITSVLRAKPDINVFYRTPCSGASRFSRRLSSAHTQIDHFSQALPDSLMLRIFFCLNRRDLLSVMLVCRRFGQIANDKTLWEFMNLADRLIDEETIHALIDRQLKVLRLASAEIKPLSLFSWYNMQQMSSAAQLTHLDLSQAKFGSSATMMRLLSRCKSLQALSLESCELLDDECCRAIASNLALRYLDLVYAKRLTVVGIELILNACKKLVELNLAWAEIDDDAMRAVCRLMPSGVRRLNLSGFRRLPSLNDHNIDQLCALCPCLEELDLSDNVLLTENCIESICNLLKRLRRLTLSRCYGIEPMAFLQLSTLDELNIFGCITNDGVCLLRNRLAPTRINASPYSTVAKPTVGDSMTSIWRQRTRDLY